MDVCWGADGLVPTRARRPMTTKHRLNYRQADVLRRLHAISAELPDGWVATRLIGSRTALQHLLSKGLVERRDLSLPSGMRSEWRPIQFDD